MGIKSKIQGKTNELYTERYYNQEVYPEEEKLRKVKRNFSISTSTIGVIPNDNLARNILDKERQMFYLKIMFIGLLLCIYSFL